jgi:ATP-grasp domain
MNPRRAMLRFISQRLGRREVIWGGLRADDIEAISDLAQLGGSFAVVGGRDRGGAIPSLDFEDLSGVRPDLDSWDIEEHLEMAAVHEFRQAMLRRLAAPTALLPYRSSGFLSAILFARRDRCLDLGLFGAHRAIFEHKPWVETMVAKLGVPRIEWTYVADEEQWRVRHLVSEGPVVLRLSRSSGGAGFVRVDDPRKLAASWPHHPEAVVGVTPYLDGATPVNIGATVWHDGVTMRHPSVQLIGIPGCTIRPFGYCGNDFGLATELDGSILATIEQSVLALGRWLRRYGYLGTFGVDFLVHRGRALFTEINPRFQGSTHASSQLSSEAGDSCVILDHIAAMLGHDAPPMPSLHDAIRGTSDLAHLVVHWSGDAGHVDGGRLAVALHGQPGHCRTDVVAKGSIITDSGGVVVRVTARRRLTTTGFDLTQPWAGLIESGLSDAVTHEALARR